MMVDEVIIYVEGPSDRDAMEALLAPLLQQKRQAGIAVVFEPQNGKRFVLIKAPRKAVDIILNKSNSIVVAMPDLYPKDDGFFRHETFDELKAGILAEFDKALQRRNIGDDAHLKARFKVFCFKHDLEALVLAAEEALKGQLGLDQLEVTWQRPVEDQDHNDPPKRIVERLFKKHGKYYRGTVHAPLILGASDYLDIADKCPQCFKPFVDFLTNIQPTSYE